MKKRLKKVLTVLALTAAAFLLPSAAVWTASTTRTGSSKAVCSVGNEGIAGPTTPTDGVALGSSTASVAGFVVTLEAPIGTDAAAQNLVPAGVYLRAWLFNPEGKAPDGGVGGWWSRAPELDLGPTTGGKLSETWAGFKVTTPLGRLAYLPDTYGNTCTVYINTTYSR